jgi:hypothetical protein
VNFGDRGNAAKGEKWQRRSGTTCGKFAWPPVRSGIVAVQQRQQTGFIIHLSQFAVPGLNALPLSCYSF